MQLRSPKERTEYTTNPQVSKEGTTLFHHTLHKKPEEVKVKNVKTYCFAPSNRFGYYKYTEERLPREIGPGSYNYHEQFKNLVKSPC